MNRRQAQFSTFLILFGMILVLFRPVSTAAAPMSLTDALTQAALPPQCVGLVAYRADFRAALVAMAKDDPQLVDADPNRSVNAFDPAPLRAAFVDAAAILHRSDPSGWLTDYNDATVTLLALYITAIEQAQRSGVPLQTMLVAHVDAFAAAQTRIAERRADAIRVCPAFASFIPKDL